MHMPTGVWKALDVVLCVHVRLTATDVIFRIIIRLADTMTQVLCVVVRKRRDDRPASRSIY
jgi:hypothetical protein